MNDRFYGLPVTSAQCIIGTEKYPDSARVLNYDDDYSQGYGKTKEAFRALTKDDILGLYKADHDFRFSIEGNDIGYSLYAFDILYQKNLEIAQRESRK